MLCSSDDICNPVGCASKFFCVPSRGMNETMETIPGFISRSYATPQRLQQIRKRQSKSQSSAKRKNSKLDTASVMERPEGEDTPDSWPKNTLSPRVSNSTIASGSSGYGPSVSTEDSAKSLSSQSSESINSLNWGFKNRCDTMELSRVRKSRLQREEAREAIMNTHFDRKLSLPVNNSLSVHSSLLHAKQAVFRSSSTACISPVRKTSLDIPSPEVYRGYSQPLYVNQNSSQDGAADHTQNSMYVSMTGNSLKSAFSSNSLYASIQESPRRNSSAASLRRDARKAFRTRSKSFGSREMLPVPSLSKVEIQDMSSENLERAVMNTNNLKRDLSQTFSTDASGPSSTTCSSSSSSLSSSPQCSASNTNNINILVENTKNVLAKSEKKSKSRKKLKGSKKLSKSLHSLLPIGCTGSLTLNHDNSYGDSIYQSIPQNKTDFQRIDYQVSDQPSPKEYRGSSSLSVLKSYTKWKNHKSERPSISDPVPIDFPKSFSTHHSTNTLKTSKSKSKSLKSLSKSPFLSCVATKDLWYNKLAQVIAEEKESTPPTTHIQVSYYDPNTAADICKTVQITSSTNARECISLILDHLEMRDVDVTKFQLWVKSSLEDSPYPLIGHEFPFAIKWNCMRETHDVDSEQFNSSANSSAVDAKCQFILRQERKPGLDGLTPGNGGKKVSKKARKSPMRFGDYFKKSNSKVDSVDGPANSPAGILFGHSLAKLFESNNSALPKPVMDMLTQLFHKGPFTVGIFRKSANARLVRELREKLDSGCPTDLSSMNITVVAALFKEFLRSLPDALLCSQLHDEWLEITQLPTVRDQISQTLLLCSRLPRANLILLQHFLCILHHIARRSSQNMMPPSNLAVCVGPSLLWSDTTILTLSPEASKQAPSVMEFLIDRFGEVFGEAMLRIMGDPPEQDSTRQDSGAEESDSLHSGHSLHSCNGRRDDSSIDSLERDLEGELSPLPRKDKMSLTNLSRDSGLTMSDTQLYTPDEEESESTSSGHSSGDKNMAYPDHRNVERVQHYPAPNNPNAIYTAVCRRPEKSNGYDEPENYYATPSREHTRVHITYSTPSYGNKEYSPQPYTPERLNDSSTMNYENDSIYSVPSTDRHTNVLEIENITSHFQRDDPMRRKSNLRKAYKNNAAEGGITRSTSEESLLSKYHTHEYGMSLSAGGAAMPRSSSKDRARSPATIEYDDNAGFISRDSAIRRSRSAHYLAEVRKEKLKDNSDISSPISRSASQDTVGWLRSRSTPHIHDEVDRSYDSSTLSDDDSTPHVSRSNSRGKECGNGSNGHWDPSQTPSDSGNSRNSSFKSERTGSVCTVISAGSCSTLSSNPPSYEDTLNRRSIMLLHQQVPVSPAPYNELSIREEKLKSNHAKQVYADSLRLYQEEKVFGDIVRASPAHAHDIDEVDCPPPLPPKGDPPPLPPKQRSSRRGGNDNSSRLKHLPPVHVETQQSARKSKQNTTPTTSASNYGPTMHKTIIYTDVGPPNLPPKERTVIEVVESTSDKLRQQTVRTVTQPVVEKKSIETQTDDCDLDEDDDIRDEDSPSSDAWLSDHITSVHVPDNTYNNYHNISNSIVTSNSSKVNTKRRGRARRRDSSASQRSRSVPSRDHHSSTDSEEEDWDSPTSHEYPGTANYGLRDFRPIEPELRGHISWSVSQLRAIFGESLQGAKVHPPPYRPPPAAGRAPITSYHLGAGDTFCRKSSRPQTSYGEESYV